MAKRSTKVIVIDADIARAAGPEDATHPRSRVCREVLLTILDVCHRMAISQPILEEWKEQQSSFAKRWLSTMVAKRKVVRVDTGSTDSVLGWIRESETAWRVDQEMWKDAHILGAALDHDRIVLSLDETVRSLFGDLSVTHSQIRSVLWGNPERPEEEVCEWVAAGARNQRHRTLGQSHR